MTHARLPVALPAYDAERVARQRIGVRTATLFAAVILVAFSALDRFTAPNAWAE